MANNKEVIETIKRIIDEIDNSDDYKRYLIQSYLPGWITKEDIEKEL